MRFAIEKKELLSCIQHLVSVAPTKNASPILTNYLIQASEDTSLVRITASDLKITVVVEFTAAVSESGTIAVSARHFNEIINFMPEAMIDFWRHDELLMIQCKKIDFNLLIADHTLFPEVPKVNFDKAIRIDGKLLDRMISKTMFAVSTDVNRAVLTGVCWKIMQDMHLMAATDGRKVAEIKIKNSSLLENPGELSSASEENIFPDAARENEIERIIPVKTLSFLQKILEGSKTQVKVLIEPSKMIFSCDNFLVFSQVIEHKFPEYQKAFVDTLQNQFEIDKETLREAIRRVALVAPDDNMRIRFELDSERFEVNTSDRDTGDAKENLEDYSFQGSQTGVSFNFRYMISILEAVDSEKVIIRLGTSKDPMMIYNQENKENEEITFLLMPLRS
ncbi:MAG: DNA polymerase III subunit beta [Candidatus Cloacimonadaceae bacterium]|jgi:DNA polymerase-3 subunit beta|nr:DNA polymerase III subunit beta [Candidatus Cloacimonadota bacterium]MCK9178484.1 DNA polymerase III subunit beta [Candidatus Cloacimonadota bacterium]MDD3104407.1 DNA polymerase III subunit beta [Candidatus Cloacimonadota bacterium]MDD3533871.1 DNA polymerase III subunit beta [Candidatus Cloacimonadota bacterium]MDY0128170.1 DNA polymerase III subunit beta [Candidatus Cloacimonadaceae bacterium]